MDGVTVGRAPAQISEPNNQTKTHPEVNRNPKRKIAYANVITIAEAEAEASRTETGGRAANK